MTNCAKCRAPVDDPLCGWVVDECIHGKRKSFAGEYARTQGKMTVPKWIWETVNDFLAKQDKRKDAA